MAFNIKDFYGHFVHCIRNAKIETGSFHHSADGRVFARVRTPGGELRFEDRDGWITDRFQVGALTFRPVDFGGVKGDEERRDLVEAIGDVMHALGEAFREGKISGCLDLSAAEAKRFVQ